MSIGAYIHTHTHTHINSGKIVISIVTPHWLHIGMIFVNSFNGVTNCTGLTVLDIMMLNSSTFLSFVVVSVLLKQVLHVAGQRTWRSRRSGVDGRQRWETPQTSPSGLHWPFQHGLGTLEMKIVYKFSRQQFFLFCDA